MATWRELFCPWIDFFTRSGTAGTLATAGGTPALPLRERAPATEKRQRGCRSLENAPFGAIFIKFGGPKAHADSPKARDAPMPCGGRTVPGMCEEMRLEKRGFERMLE